MTIVIVLEKEDIKTRQVETNTVIETESGMMINFTPEAIEEFLKDIAEIKRVQSEGK